MSTICKKIQEVMKRILVLLAVAVSCVIAVRAAEIYGYVVDKADSSPLINA